MRRLEFHITYHCPEKCVFCSEEHRMERYHSFPVTFARVATVLRQQAERGVEHVHFTGGEPTIHPQFVEILVLAKKLGMRTSIGTIGTRLADPSFARAALPYLDEALFSLHGPDAATHDALTRRPGSFARVMQAIEHARQFPGFRLYINSVLTVHNLSAMPATTRLAKNSGASLQVISNLTPEGGGEDHYPELTVRLSQLAALAPRLVEEAGSMILRFFGVPMCILGAHRQLSNDLHWNPRVTVEWASQPGKVVLDGIYSWSPERKRAHGQLCTGCSYQGVCSGAFAEYLTRFGEAELQASGTPVHEASNNPTLPLAHHPL
jgi:MoaA/NifB/PqqE/SkfB family radical SAM enzyme